MYLKTCHSSASMKTKKYFELFIMSYAMWDLNISALEGARASIFALRSNKSHGPLSESRVSRRSEKLNIPTLLETLDSDSIYGDLNKTGQTCECSGYCMQTNKMVVVTLYLQHYSHCVCSMRPRQSSVREQLYFIH